MVEDTPDDLVMELFSRGVLARPPARPADPGHAQAASSGFEREDLASFFRRVYHPDNIVIAAAGHLEHERPRSLRRPPLRRPSRQGARGTGHAAERPRPRRDRDALQEGAGAGARVPGRARLSARATTTATALHHQHRAGRQHVLAAVPERAREARPRATRSPRASPPTPTPAASRSTPGPASTRSTRWCASRSRRSGACKGEHVPADELRRAKDHLKGSLMLSLENTGSRMNHLARQEIYFGRQFGARRDAARGSRRSSGEDVRRIANEIFDGDLRDERARQPRGAIARSAASCGSSGGPPLSRSRLGQLRQRDAGRRPPARAS